MEIKLKQNKTVPKKNNPQDFSLPLYIARFHAFPLASERIEYGH